MESFFGDVNADDSDRVFRFGKDGQPVLFADASGLDLELLSDEEWDMELVDESDLNRRDEAS